MSCNLFVSNILSVTCKTTHFLFHFKCRCDFNFETLRIHFPLSFFTRSSLPLTHLDLIFLYVYFLFFFIYCFIYLFSNWSGPVNLSGLDVALRREIYWALADGEALLLSQSERELGVYYLDGCTAEEGGRLNISVTNRGSH